MPIRQFVDQAFAVRDLIILFFGFSFSVWYKGVEVHSYLFEVTDEKAKTHFSYTRPGTLLDTAMN